jgi:hypothetical protein
MVKKNTTSYIVRKPFVFNEIRYRPNQTIELTKKEVKTILNDAGKVIEPLKV